jgi:hypothetical protein
MFFFNPPSRFAARSALVLIALCALLAFSGCSTEATPDTGFTLEGKWASDYDESYTITKTTVEYKDNFGNLVKGDVEKHAVFSGNSGVLIFKAAEVKGTFYKYTAGKYGAVYYKEGTGSAIKMGFAADPSDYAVIQQDNLQAAEADFTRDKADTYISFWGVYTRQ